MSEEEKKETTARARFDILLRNGRIMDGAGNPWFNADIAIKDGKIIKIGRLGSEKATSIIDVSNLIVSPGFIDIHNHSDTSLIANPKMESKIRQGITTEVNGNCGSSPSPVNANTLKGKGLRKIPEEDVDWTTMGGYFQRLERQGISQNVITLVGHGTVRRYVMGDHQRMPTQSELDEMKGLVRAAMEDGASGLSTGLSYAPGCYAHTDEVVELAKIVAEYDGIYASHLRERGSEVLGWTGEYGSIYRAVDEAIEIGRRSGVRVIQLSHLISHPPFLEDPDMSGKIRRLIDASREEGLNVNADILPSDWGSVAPWPGRSVFSPSYLADGKDKLFEKLRDPMQRAQLKEELQTRSPSEMGFENTTDRLLLIREGKGDCIRIYPPFNGHMKNPEYEKKTLDEIAKMKGKDLFDTLFDLLVEEDGNICVTNKNMDDTMSQLTWSTTMPSTDGGGIERTGDKATKRVRPSAYGGFPEALAWVREKQQVTLEDMVRRMTSLPALAIGLTNRGLLKEGFWADVTIFDPINVRSMCNYDDDARPEYPEGIPFVIVNGVLVIKNSEHTNSMPGMVLRHPF
jgi:N-acyl-D-aspartate/D-glutamate deacylase